MKNEDTAEMVRLRKAKGFQMFQAKYGNRTKAKQQMEEKEGEREKLIDALRAQREAYLRDQEEKGSEEMSDAMRAMFPSTFGAKPKKATTVNHVALKRKVEEKKPLFKSSISSSPSSSPSPSPSPSQSSSSEDKSAEEEDVGTLPQAPEAEEIANPYKLPISHEVSLKGHTKAIAALSVDKKGARVLTGSYDYQVRMYDFAGMNKSFQSFRDIEPEEGHQVCQVEWSLSSDRFLACTASCRPKIYDREGIEICQFPRGDMYLVDLAYTYGHVTGCTGGHWDPKESQHVLTCSLDSTLRLWDLEMPKRCFSVIKLKDKMGKRAGVTACAFTSSGNTIAGAGVDGSIQLWSKRNKFSRAEKVVQNAHVPGTETSSLTFHPDNFTLLSRGGDHTLKMWDIRKFKEPTQVWNDLENFYAQTDAIWSPDGNIIVTGTSNKADQGEGRLVFFSRKENRRIMSVSVSNRSCVRLSWHPDLNQLMVGCSDATTKILYNPILSQKGVLGCVSRTARRKDASDFIEYMEVRNPHALPLYKDPPRKKQRYLDRKDPLKSKIPFKPKNDIPGKGIGGALASRNLTAHFMKQMVEKQIQLKDQDPREEILKFAKKALDDPKYLGPAYSRTQPKAIFQNPKDFEEEDERNEKIKKITAAEDKKK